MFNTFLSFSRANWWIYPVFALVWSGVWWSNRGSPIDVGATFVVHLMADITIMVSMYEESQKRYREAVLYLLISNSIFFGIAFSGVLIHGSWQYILAQIVTTTGGFLSYGRHRGWSVSRYAVPIVIALSLLIIDIEILYSLIPTFSGFVQMLSILGMGISFAMKSGKYRYLVFLVSDIVLIGGSLTEAIIGWTHGDISGISVSYTLFPIVAFLYFASLWSSFFGKKDVIAGV